MPCNYIHTRQFIRFADSSLKRVHLSANILKICLFNLKMLLILHCWTLCMKWFYYTKIGLYLLLVYLFGCTWLWIYTLYFICLLFTHRVSKTPEILRTYCSRKIKKTHMIGINSQIGSKNRMWEYTYFSFSQIQKILSYP